VRLPRLRRHARPHAESDQASIRDVMRMREMNKAKATLSFNTRRNEDERNEQGKGNIDRTKEDRATRAASMFVVVCCLAPTGRRRRRASQIIQPALTLSLSTNNCRRSYY
jgi:hypothetical protein